MSDTTGSVYVCGGRMQLLFRSVAAVEDGRPVTHLVPDRALWDGQPVSEIVAEALAATWYAAHDGEASDG